MPLIRLLKVPPVIHQTLAFLLACLPACIDCQVPHSLFNSISALLRIITNDSNKITVIHLRASVREMSFIRKQQRTREQTWKEGLSMERTLCYFFWVIQIAAKGPLTCRCTFSSFDSSGLWRYLIFSYLSQPLNPSHMFTPTCSRTRWVFLVHLLMWDSG